MLNNSRIDIDAIDNLEAPKSIKFLYGDFFKSKVILNNLNVRINEINSETLKVK